MHYFWDLVMCHCTFPLPFPPSSSYTHVHTDTHTHIHWPHVLFHFLGHEADSDGVEREMVIVPRRILVILSKGWRRRQPTCMKLGDMLREGFYMPCPQRFQRKHETESSSFHFAMTYSVFILRKIWEEKRSKGKLCRFPYFQAPLLKFFIDGR